VSPKRLRVGDIVHMDTGRMFLVEAITETHPAGSLAAQDSLPSERSTADSGCCGGDVAVSLTSPSPGAECHRSAEASARDDCLPVTCPVCDQPMKPEHAHYRCTGCGYRDSCCM